LLFWGVLRRTPQTPRSLRGSESRCARSPLPGRDLEALDNLDRAKAPPALSRST
jgi:hypothetical protein